MKSLYALLVLFLIGSQADAAFRRRVVPTAPVHVATRPAVMTVTKPVMTVTTTHEAIEALDEVNAARARRGLPPFIRDPLLTIGAMTLAKTRAARHIAGHTSNDFAALPPGAHAKATGCGALEPSWGWGSCCTYDRYTYAGAALVHGSDGKRYMHLVVR